MLPVIAEITEPFGGQALESREKPIIPLDELCLLGLFNRFEDYVRGMSQHPVGPGLLRESEVHGNSKVTKVKLFNDTYATSNHCCNA